MNFDRFDVCEAHYCFAYDYHDGQFSETYKIFGRLDRIGFKPAMNLKYETLSENGKDIYDSLVNNS